MLTLCLKYNTVLQPYLKRTGRMGGGTQPTNQPTKQTNKICCYCISKNSVTQKLCV